MLQKILAILFAVGSFNLVVYSMGWPEVGTFGFLVLINLFQVYFFLAYQSEVKYTRHLYAGTASLIAILAATLALFRANEASLRMLGVLSISLSTISLYLFSSGHVNVTSILEGLFIPLSLIRAWFQAWFSVTSNVTLGLAKILKLYNIKALSPHLLTFLLAASIFVPLSVVMMLIVLSLDPFVFDQIHRLLSVAGINLQAIPAQIHQRFSLSVLLLMLIVPLTFLETAPLLTFDQANHKLHWLKNFVTLISALIMVLLIVLTYLRFTQLVFGASNTAPVVDRSTILLTYIHFFTIAGSIFILSSIGVWLMRLLVTKDMWLRLSLGSANLVLFVSSFVYAGFLAQYISEQGLTRLRLYGVALLILVAVYCLVFSARMVMASYWGWQVSEITLFVCFVFFLNLANIDGLIVQQQYQFTAKPDHTYVASLSADAVEGWIRSFEYAKSTVQNYSQTSDPEDLQQAHLILSQLRVHYWKLTLKYGSHRQIETLSYLGTYQEETNPTMLYRLSHTNLAGWYAYQTLTNAVATDDLVKLEKTASELTTN